MFDTHGDFDPDKYPDSYGDCDGDTNRHSSTYVRHLS
jgi:hypothetical protein